MSPKILFQARDLDSPLQRVANRILAIHLHLQDVPLLRALFLVLVVDFVDRLNRLASAARVRDSSASDPLPSSSELPRLRPPPRPPARSADSFRFHGLPPSHFRIRGYFRVRRARQLQQHLRLSASAGLAAIGSSVGDPVCDSFLVCRSRRAVRTHPSARASASSRPALLTRSLTFRTFRSCSISGDHVTSTITCDDGTTYPGRTPIKTNKDRQTKSNPNRTDASRKITKITTTELRTNSPRDGQETLFISASTAIRKSANCGHIDDAIAQPDPDSQHTQDQQIGYRHVGTAAHRHPDSPRGQAQTRPKWPHRSPAEQSVPGCVCTRRTERALRTSTVQSAFFLYPSGDSHILDTSGAAATPTTQRLLAIDRQPLTNARPRPSIDLTAPVVMAETEQKMAGAAGIELATSGFGDQRSAN